MRGVCGSAHVKPALLGMLSALLRVFSVLCARDEFVILSWKLG
jgi:hypothetical protein